VWRLSQDQKGCLKVQEALQGAGSDDARRAIAAELEGHVWEAMRCPHANHVVQKCIMTMRPHALQFIIDEIESRGAAGVRKIAKHQYGCRILQRLLEHCRPDQVQGLVEDLLAKPYCSPSTSMVTL